MKNIKNQDIHLYDCEMNYPSADGGNNNYIPSVSYTKSWEYNEEVVNNVEDLMAALELGGNIRLEADLELDEAIKVSNSVTIILNGKTIKSSGDGFEVVKGGELVISGDGEINAGLVPGSNCAIWANGGYVVVQGGSFSVGTDSKGCTNDCVYAKGGTIIINGGTFKNSGKYDPNSGGVIINSHNSIENSKVIVYNGEFIPTEGGIIVEKEDLNSGRVIWKKKD